jgi:hypothetical protein
MSAPTELRETLDLVGHPALSFLDIPTEVAPKLVAELGSVRKRSRLPGALMCGHARSGSVASPVVEFWSSLHHPFSLHILR